MPITEALMIAVSGFLTVFLMLVLLWAIIELVNRVVTGMTKEKEPAGFVPDNTPEPAAEPVRPHSAYGGEVALYDVDEKTAACIMAIVSDSTKIPLDHLIFKSIRALD